MMQVENYPVLIQFGYKAGRGKDTACSIIQEEFGERFAIRKYAYGDALRAEVLDMAFEAWRVAHPHEADSDACNAPSPTSLMENLCQSLGFQFDTKAQIEPGYPLTKQRSVYQHVGMARRAEDAFYWVNKTRSRIEAELPQIATVSDMRFFNERAYGLAFKGYNIKLVRPDLDEKEALSAAQAKHVSEIELDSLPDSAFYRVITHTSVADLRRQVIQLFNDILAELEPPDIMALFNDPNAHANIILPN